MNVDFVLKDGRFVQKGHDRVVRRADNLQVELSLAPQLAARVDKAKAMALATPGRAQAELTLVERELETLAATTPMLEVAGVLRGVWETIQNEQLTANPQLVAMYTDTLQHLMSGDLKTAAGMTQKLRNVLLDFKARRDPIAHRQIFLHEKFEADIPTEEIAKDVSLRFNMSEDAATELVKWKLRELKSQEQATRPQGFKPSQAVWNEMRAIVNRLLPGEARPKFSLDEAYALNA